MSSFTDCRHKVKHELARGQVVVFRCVGCHQFLVRCAVCEGTLGELPPDYENVKCRSCGHEVRVTDDGRQMRLF